MTAAKATPDWINISVFQKLVGRILPRRNRKKACASFLSVRAVNPEDDIVGASEVSLRSIFNYFDLNGDGKIAAEELWNCARMVGGELTLEEAEGAVKDLDLDGDGMLGFEEFVELMEGKRGEDERERELKEAFRMFETEENGGITASGLKRMLRRLGEVWSMEECRMMIREFDLDGNGVINFDEFVAMMR